jgi:hypothetical protein
VAKLGLVALPEGAVRDLFEHLHRLHRYAGEPSTRKIAAGSRKALSHTAVHAAFTGARGVPSWAILEPIVRYLGGDLDQFRRLWVHARDHEDSSDGTDPVGAHLPEPVRRPRSAPGRSAASGAVRDTPRKVGVDDGVSLEGVRYSRADIRGLFMGLITDGKFVKYERGTKVASMYNQLAYIAATQPAEVVYELTTLVDTFGASIALRDSAPTVEATHPLRVVLDRACDALAAWPLNRPADHLSLGEAVFLRREASRPRDHES